MIIGIIGGIIAVSFNIKQLWWLEIILVAALVNTLILQAANYQKYTMFRELEDG